MLTGSIDLDNSIREDRTEDTDVCDRATGSIDLDNNSEGGDRVGDTDIDDRATSSMNLDDNEETNDRVIGVRSSDININVKGKVTVLGKKPDLCTSQVFKVTNKVTLHDEVDKDAGIFTDILENLFGFLSSLFLETFSSLILSFLSIPTKLFGSPGNQKSGNILAFFYMLICLFDYRATF